MAARTANSAFAALLASALFSVMGSPAARADDGTHSLTLNIPENARLRINANSNVSKASNGTESSVDMDTVLQLSVKKQVNGYLVSQNTTGLTFNTIDGQKVPNDPPATQELMAMFSPVTRFDFQADDALVPVEVKDLNALAANAIDTIIAIEERKSGGKALPASERKKLQDAMSALYTSYGPENAAQMFAPMSTLLGQVRDIDLVVDEPLSGEVEAMPGIFQIVTITLGKWDVKTDTAQIAFDKVIDGDKSRQGLRTLIVQMMSQMQAPADATGEADAMFKDAKFDLSSHCDYTAAISTGLITKATCRNRQVIGYKDQISSKTEVYTLSETLDVAQ